MRKAKGKISAAAADGGLVTVTLTMSRTASKQAIGMVNAGLTLAAASEKVLFGDRKEVRITTMVPETLYQNFSAFCRRKGSDVNSMLVSRIGRVVSEDGVFQVKRASSWEEHVPHHIEAVPERRNTFHQVQVSLPPAQATGLKRMCKKSGFTVGHFILSRIGKLLGDDAERKQPASNASAGSPDKTAPATH